MRGNFQGTLVDPSSMAQGVQKQASTDPSLGADDQSESNEGAISTQSVAAQALAAAGAAGAGRPPRPQRRRQPPLVAGSPEWRAIRRKQILAMRGAQLREKMAIAASGYNHEAGTTPIMRQRAQAAGLSARLGDWQALGDRMDRAVGRRLAGVGAGRRRLLLRARARMGAVRRPRLANRRCALRPNAAAAYIWLL